MLAPAIPNNEAARLAELRSLNILDTPREERFDAIVRMARHLFEVPIAYIALIDSDRQWFKSSVGLSASETSREVSFCGHAILGQTALVVPNALEDDRFRDNPMVVGDPYIRFYAGHPLRGPSGHNVGTLCLCDQTPRELDEKSLDSLNHLAQMAERELQLMEVIRAQQQLLETRQALAVAQKKLAAELRDASEYVKSQLPARIEGPVTTDWEFQSSSELGGDLFGYHWLDEDETELAIYLIDVCGHGVGAALLSVQALTTLRRQTLPNICFSEPADVLAGLNLAFPMDEHNEKFFTAWYGVYHAGRKELYYASAGHPPALLFQRPGSSPKQLGHPSLMIGVDPDEQYETGRIDVLSGARLVVFSDGVFEVEVAPGQMLGVNGLARLICEAPAESTSARQIRETLQQRQGTPHFADDFSLLTLRFR